MKKDIEVLAGNSQDVLGLLPRSTCAAYALIGGLFGLLCNIAR